jgi:glycosyltransferase involved in cell wall biosynthesis
MHQKLTVLIPCKDERSNIRGCIESVRGVADEVLVADSGSTDGTQDIVAALGGCRLIEREFIGYADFKNWAIPQATHPWVLIVDADERVTRELTDEIQQTLRNPPDDVDGYWIFRRNFFMGHEIKHCGWNTDDVCRLIRRDKCRYGDRLVHEEIDIEPLRSRRLKNRLDHYTVQSYDHYFEKRLRYTELSARHSWDRGERTGLCGLLFRPMLRFLQLYLMRLGFLDGLAGVQVCMITAYFNTFVRQARLWEMEHAVTVSDAEFDDQEPDKRRQAA